MAVAIGIIYVFVSLYVIRTYSDFEQTSAARDLERLKQVFAGDLEAQGTTAYDWASWDDTFDFMQDQNPDYAESNLVDDTFLALGVTYIILADTNGKIVLSKGVDLDEEEQIDLPASLTAHFGADSALLATIDPDAPTTWLLRIEDGILMVSSAPILRSDDSGPSRGTFFMASYLGAGKVAQMQARTRLDFAALEVGGDALADGQRQVVAQLASEMGEDALSNPPTRLETVNKDILAGYMLVPDVFGAPLILWAMNLPRDIYKQGQTSLAYLIGALVLVGAVMIVTLLILIEKIVLKRLVTISGQVAEIGRSHDLSKRVLDFGADELGALGKSVNWMLGEMETTAEKLAHEHERAEKLLLNILPEPIAVQLKQNNEPIAESFEQVSILFADIVGFTRMSARMEPAELVAFLNEVFSAFDDLADKLGLEKIKTIGDAYMVAGGLPTRSDDHADTIAEMALSMMEVIRGISAKRGEQFQMRIGINTGVAVAGVIGTRKFIYDLWGDAVNVASRMEAHAESGTILVTQATCDKITDAYDLEPRGPLKVKGRGTLMTYVLVGRKQTQNRLSA